MRIWTWLHEWGTLVLFLALAVYCAFLAVVVDSNSEAIDKWQKDHDKSVSQSVATLIANQDTLKFYLTGDSTYIMRADSAD